MFFPVLGALAEYALPFLAGLGVCAIIAWVIASRQLKQLNDRHQRELLAAEKEQAAAVREVRSLASLEAERNRTELQTEQAKREAEVDFQKRELEAREKHLRETEEALERQKSSLKDDHDTLERERVQVKQDREKYRDTLQSLSGLNADEARQMLLAEIERDAEDQLRNYRNRLLSRGESEIDDEARRVLIDALQRLAATPQVDLTGTFVSLRGDDMKGRIIGREGRNIKAFESATGVTLLIDESPDSVLISSFDPVRREVARIALDRLIKDGRIHPASIEDAVRDANEQIKTSVIEFGEDALRRARVNHLHPEIVSLLGRLRFRLSNNQNSLDHSVEVAHLASLLAAELRLDPDIARRVGLLHDIGKSLDPDHEGSHALAAARLLNRHGEDKVVVNAVAAHHEEVPAESPYAPVLMIADGLSAMRPGARAESMDAYIQRVAKLEALAHAHPGVEEAYAIQAGREIRVIINANESSDEDARLLARDLRRNIEEELVYPGTIKITVLRESRFVEQAR